MIAQVRVLDLEHALKVARAYDDNYTAWISVMDPEDERDCFNIKRLLGRRNVLHFHRFFRDFDDGEADVETHGPNKEDIELLVKFLTELKYQDKNHFVGINCRAGISRSSASAIVAWMVAGFQPEVALDKVLLVRPIAWPNCRILRFYDEIAGTNSAEVVLDWKKKLKGKLFTNTAWT